MFDVFIREHIALIRKYWYKWTGLVLLVTLVTIILLYLFYSFDVFYLLGISALENKNKITEHEYYLCAVLLSFVVALWYRSTAIPKTKSNKVGIIVAIVVESENERTRLNDFIHAFQDRIDLLQKDALFDLIVYPDYYASCVTRSNCNTLLAKSKAHFMIFGSLKKRFHKKKEHYIFNIDSIVRHAPIPQQISLQLANEMNEIFPKEIMIKQDNEYEGFQVSNEWTAIVTEHIIAVAAYLTGDFNLASRLHENIANELKIISPIPSLVSRKAIDKMKLRNIRRLVTSLSIKCNYGYSKYRKSGNEIFLLDMDSDINKIKKYDPQNYNAKLLKAIFYFLVDKDPDKALKELKSIKNKRDITWMYSKAFLYAYKGDLSGAHKIYKEAFGGVVVAIMPSEVDEFINDVLKREPEKYQLLFCLGLISLFARNDYVLAEGYFTDFLSNSDKIGFLAEKRLAEKYLIETKEQILKSAA